MVGGASAANTGGLFFMLPMNLSSVKEGAALFLAFSLLLWFAPSGLIACLFSFSASLSTLSFFVRFLGGFVSSQPLTSSLGDLFCESLLLRGRPRLGFWS